MVGIRHHTPAAGRGIKIPKSSYSENHDIDNASISLAKLSDHTKPNHDILSIDAGTLGGHAAAYFAVAGSTDAQTLDTLDSTAFVLVADHTQAPHNALNIAAATATLAANSSELEGQTLAQVQAGVESAINIHEGETRLWNTLKGDIPAGWHLCDGTNGTEDMSAVEPQASTNTVYIQYLGGEFVTTARTINVTNNLGANTSYTLKGLSGETITSIEDGAPFKLTVHNDTGGALYVEVTGYRTSDDYKIFDISGSGHIGHELADSSDFTYILTQHVDCTWEINSDAG